MEATQFLLDFGVVLTLQLGDILHHLVPLDELLTQTSFVPVSLIIADNDRGRHQHEEQLRPPGRSHRHLPLVFASPVTSDVHSRLVILLSRRQGTTGARFASEIQTGRVVRDSSVFLRKLWETRKEVRCPRLSAQNPWVFTVRCQGY